MSEEYDLKKSENKIGQLYPVLVTKDGKIIDGFHRKDADPNWKTLVLPEIDDEEKLLAARLIANFHRRHVEQWEKEEWINGLARIYQKEGLKVSVRVGSAQPRNQIIDKIGEVTGLDETTIRDYISSEFKQKQPEQFEEQKPRVPASEKVEKTLGKKGADAYKKQVLAEANLSPQERGALTKKRQQEKEERQRKREENRKIREEKKIEEKAKSLKANELLKDADFRKELITQIQRPKEEQDENSKVNREIIDKMVEEYVPAIAKAFSELKPENPHEPERNKLVLNMLLKNLEQGLIFCPICGKQMLECSSCHVSLRKMKERVQI